MKEGEKNEDEPPTTILLAMVWRLGANRVVAYWSLIAMAC